MVFDVHADAAEITFGRWPQKNGCGMIIGQPISVCQTEVM